MSDFLKAVFGTLLFIVAVCAVASFETLVTIHGNLVRIAVSEAGR